MTARGFRSNRASSLRVQRVATNAPIGATRRAKLSSAQQAIVMTPEFNTMGAPFPLDCTRADAPIGTSTAVPRPVTDYKAFVLFYFAGGQDSWNMMVPAIGNRRYNQYLQHRTVGALRANDMINLQGTHQGERFALHSSYQAFANLYNQERSAAIFTNIGNLQQPIERRGNGECARIGSHSDQTNAAKTLKCQETGTAARGVGGRIADQLVDTHKVGVFSTDIWAQGFEDISTGVSEGSEIQNLEGWRPFLTNITRQRYGNAYSEAFANFFSRSVKVPQEEEADLGDVLSRTTLSTQWSANDGLNRDLKGITRLMQTAQARGASRDFFYLRMGGWDSHRNMRASIDPRFRIVDQALASFAAEVKANNQWNNVVLMTQSEFGRTLDINGNQGSDHGWAGQAMMMGGSVRGGQIHNQYPEDMSPNYRLNYGRGRMVPQFPWESMYVPVANWMGVTSEEKLAAVFPNIGNFQAEHLNTNVEVFG